MSEELPQEPKLTTEQQSEILNWAQTKWVNYKCECCQSPNFQLQPHLVAPPIFGSGYIIGGSAYPHAVFVCMNCGNTKFINSVMIGVSQSAKKEEKDAE